MKLRIFDVCHGFCALIITDNGQSILMDCGHDSERFRPSEYLQNQNINNLHSLIVSNFDEDHLSDVHRLTSQLKVNYFYRNMTIPVNDLMRIKLQSGPLSHAMTATINLCNEYQEPLPTFIDLAGLNIRHYWNNYPNFTDTNNLSLVTILEYGNIKILYPGDMEILGWKVLLCDQNFVNDLYGVNIFIASHHGRMNGYHKEIFNYCYPDIFVISDKTVVHQTQLNSYAQHARGIPFNSGRETRYVLSTRKDGAMDFDINQNSYFVTTGITL